MNWGRGLLFAVIHLSLAVPLILWREASDWKHLRGEHRTAVLRLASFQEGTVEWDPTTICYRPTPQEFVLRFVNVPAFVFARWHLPLPPSYSVAGASEAVFGRGVRSSAVANAIGFVVLIFVQWLFVGGLRLTRSKHEWLEPATLITVSGAVSACLLALPLGGDIYGFPLIVTFGAWLVWFCIVVFKMGKLGSGASAARI